MSSWVAMWIPWTKTSELLPHPSMPEYFTLPHLFQSDSGQSDQNFRNPWNPVNFFYIYFTLYWTIPDRIIIEFIPRFHGIYPDLFLVVITSILHSSTYSSRIPVSLTGISRIHGIQLTFFNIYLTLYWTILDGIIIQLLSRFHGIYPALFLVIITRITRQSQTNQTNQLTKMHMHNQIKALLEQGLNTWPPEYTLTKTACLPIELPNHYNLWCI